MAETTSNITLTATDEASPVVQGLTGALKELQGAVQANTQALGNVRSAGNDAASGLSGATVATTALGVALGVLGVGSIQQVVRGLVDLVGQTIAAGGQMQLLQNRAQVLFGSDFPAVNAQIEVYHGYFSPRFTGRTGSGRRSG